jgi:hypothetical protein
MRRDKKKVGKNSSTKRLRTAIEILVLLIIIIIKINSLFIEGYTVS